MPNYQISGKLNAFDQLNIARKLSAAFPLVTPMVSKENDGKDKGVLVVMALGMLSDENSKFVVEKCLSLVVRIQEDGKPARLLSNGTLMFDDISLKDITDLTTQVIMENLGDFLNTALPT
jgi:hypothetical protein